MRWRGAKSSDFRLLTRRGAIHHQGLMMTPRRFLGENAGVAVAYDHTSTWTSHEILRQGIPR